MRRISLAFIVILFVTLVVAGQPLDRDCNPVGVPGACLDEKRAVEEIETRLDRVQQQLQGASPAHKPTLVRRIESINAELDTARAALNRCIREQGPPQAEVHANELTARVTGKATIETTNDNAPGPYEVDLDLSVRFSRNRCSFIVTRFPAITTKTVEIGFPLNRRVTVEITQDGSGTGSFHPVSGRMSLTIKLIFKYKTGYANPDDATFHLSTQETVTWINGSVETGSVLEGDGDIKLVGSGRFLHGFLAGATGKLLITARLSPHP